MRRALVLVLLLGGCAQVLGLEDRKLAQGNVDDGGVVDRDAGTGGSALRTDPDSGITATQSCWDYCTLAEQNCTAAAKVQLFQTFPTCLAVCNKYSTDPSTTGNTLACRIGLLRGLALTGSSEAATTCPGAGPGGGPPPNEPGGANCGTDCGGFCALRAATCPQMEGDVDCVRKCSALVDNIAYNAGADFGGGQDTLACRLAHLSAAALYDATDPVTDAGAKPTRDAHCSHSGIRSEVQCDFPMDLPPDCESYCKIVGVACTNDKAVFESNEQCLSFCKQLSDGSSGNTGDTGSKRCMRSGAYDALQGQSNGCQRAGISGDGCLGGRVASYCLYAKKACPTQFAQAYASDDDCRLKAAKLTFANIGDAFSIASTQSSGSDNMQCRLRRLLKSFGGDSSADNCAAALGLPGNMFCPP